MDTHKLFFNVQKKTDVEHVLDNPDTYIGAVEHIAEPLWTCPESLNERFLEKEVTIVPGLYKLFDEAIVNCRDHVVRMKKEIDNGTENSLPVTKIEVAISSETGEISLLNDGNGLDVVQQDGIWNPELVFAHMRTSTNYDKTEQRIVGGKNGFGFKLVLIWSVYGRVETVDHIRGLKYTQEFGPNMSVVHPPTIITYRGKPYTKVSFIPDYARFQLPNKLDPDMMGMLRRRAVDIAAITNKTVKVKYNGELIPVRTFEQYVSCYLGDKGETARVYECAGDRWEYAVGISPTGNFMQVSFVNGVATFKGGKHVEYIINQITKKVAEWIQTKKKVDINTTTIRNRLFLFLRCDIVNPSFESQTKDYMSTPPQKFGSKCEVSDKFIEKVMKLDILDYVMKINEVRNARAVKRTDGVKRRSIFGIPKLVDANWAGTVRSSECTLILCEGDSAKTGILSGLTDQNRNVYGVYPFKGKLMNVRGETDMQISSNKEIVELKQILGLTSGHEYTLDEVRKHLRYGKILFMTDQDLDGSHIKGLGINLFSYKWNSLTKLPGFIGSLNTPILKASKGGKECVFYNEYEYTQWASNPVHKSGWTIKYYKGLGTSTGVEFKKYFAEQRIMTFEHTPQSCDAIDRVFNKKRADDRKQWLSTYNRKEVLDTSKPVVSYEEFIDRELIHFSKYDCDRNIPNLMDGLKISQRKILYAAFKRNLTKEIKVAQFSGYVSEHSGYHHGEASLNAAIISMAQNFVGSNNINLFAPKGQFGSRLEGGKDHASERYIYTHLEPITRTLFPCHDDAILTYLTDDGMTVEPVYYAPILPMVLVNGCKGIGTGFSTDIPKYYPPKICQYLQNKLADQNEDGGGFVPYVHGFKGEIQKISDTKFLYRGKYRVEGEDIVIVTELPVGMWTSTFKKLVDEYVRPESIPGKPDKKPLIKDYTELSTNSAVHFTITFVPGKLAELLETRAEHGCNGLEQALKLYSTQSTTNMYLFDANDALKKYDTVEQIIDDYYEVRLQLYAKRKIHILKTLEHETNVMVNRGRYIQEIVDGTIDLRRRTKAEVSALLREKNYSEVDDGFSYLTHMPMDSVTEERVQELLLKVADKKRELEIVLNKNERQMWLDDLDIFTQHYFISCCTT